MIIVADSSALVALGKNNVHLAELRPMLTLINQTGIFLSDRVQQRALELVDEA